jgi:hypothetical protein
MSGDWRSIAVTTPTAVCVDDDLAARQTAVAVRTARDELARRINVVLHFAAHQV